MTEIDTRALTEEDLIERCRTQRSALSESFEELYRRHSDAVFRFLMSLLRSRERAEDALQEAFFRAFGALGRFELGRPFRPWILRIARNLALDQLREAKKDREQRAEGAMAAAPDPANTLTDVSRRERQDVVREALATLPAEERSVLMLRHYEGLTSQQIAEVLSCSLRTAKYRLKGAALLFGAELSRRSITSLEVI